MTLIRKLFSPLYFKGHHTGSLPLLRRAPKVICLPNETRPDESGASENGVVPDVDPEAFAKRRVEDAVFEEITEPQVSVFKKAPTPTSASATKSVQRAQGAEPLRFDRPIFLAERAPEPLAKPTPQRRSAPHTENSGKRTQARSAKSAPKPLKPGWSPGARAMALLAIVAVPAVAAAPQNLGQLPGDAPTEAQMVNAQLRADLARNPAMPFEKPGMSFPGSAFYFLADPPSEALIALPTSDASLPKTGEAGHQLGELIDAGPGADPFYSPAFDGLGGTAYMRASKCLAQAIWYEAASESEAGKRAVAQVVLNRVAHPGWPASVCGVVYQGSTRSTGCQFSFTCDGSLKRKAKGRSWDIARKLADEALAGSVYAPIGHATHYHTLWVNPYWASSLDHVGTIGAHRFYRNRGVGGRKGAFTQKYAGAEPGVNARVTAPPMIENTVTPPLHNAALTIPAANNSRAPQPSYQPPHQPSGVPAQALAGPGAVRSDTGTSVAGQVREDYSRAGQWKSDAARAAMLAKEKERANTPPEGSSQ